MSGAVVSATMKNRRKNNSQQQQTRSPQPLPPKRRKNQNQNANNEVNVADVLNEAHLLKIDNMDSKPKFSESMQLINFRKSH